ncbi:rho guanine nucleotide exchange factor 10-like protein [Trichonephila clavata]|uniref:Rho guanine nucleotide exchange factor 10-like protein n=1 Tax=Trichonephila clavata TaxID=2740835 RepID=A0A8X6GQF1_TRICU|nr:rho guanine nucleotide exchange factor 10-like protein [Trichonephila clavata]
MMIMMLSNCQEAKYARVNRIMKDGSKDEFECPVAIEFHNKIMGGVDFADQITNVYELDRKSCKWWEKSIFSPIDEGNGRLIDCVLRTQTSKNPTSLFHCNSCRSLDGVRKAQPTVSTP